MALTEWTKIASYPVSKNSEVRLYAKPAAGDVDGETEIYTAALIVNGRSAMELTVSSRRHRAMEDAEQHAKLAKKMFDAAKSEISTALRNAI